jgi:hypothetical protein
VAACFSAQGGRLPDVTAGTDGLRGDGVGLVQHRDRVGRPRLPAGRRRGEGGKSLLVVGAGALRHDVEHGLRARDRAARGVVQVVGAFVVLRGPEQLLGARDRRRVERAETRRVDHRHALEHRVGEISLDMRDLVDFHPQLDRDHPVRCERQHLLAAVGEHHLHAVDRAVLEAGDQAGALADVRGRDPAPDQRVHQGRLTGLDPAGDGHLQRGAQPAKHLGVARCRSGGNLRPQAVAPGSPPTWTAGRSGAPDPTVPSRRPPPRLYPPANRAMPVILGSHRRCYHWATRSMPNSP